MSKIGLIQVDGNLPNLALMKLATWHKAQGDEVTIVDISSHRFDKIYGSKIFMGGSGYDLKATLPADIEEVTPDYELFGLDHSIGFSSRGCGRNCGFCIVQEKEGPFRDADTKWITKEKVILLDNNFLVSRIWKDKLETFIKNKNKVCFNQGLDIRLITPEKADVLARVKYYDLGFKKRRLYFALDNPAIEPQIHKGIFTLEDAGVPPTHLMFYILVGFNTTFEEDVHRFNVIDQKGCLPYIMLYNRTRDRNLTRFARWVNGRYYKVCKFEDYK
jgi:hypothetical protein